jgi:hypothetical protein
MMVQAMELKPDALRRMQDEHGIDWQGEHFSYRYLPRLLGDFEARPAEQRYNWVLLLRAGARRWPCTWTACAATRKSSSRTPARSSPASSACRRDRARRRRDRADPQPGRARRAAASRRRTTTDGRTPAGVAASRCSCPR